MWAERRILNNSPTNAENPAIIQLVRHIYEVHGVQSVYSVALHRIF